MKQIPTYPHTPVKGKFHVITGENGTGKSRYLAKLSSDILKGGDNKNSRYARLICLSGTVYEKFPKVTQKRGEDIQYIYFGNKTNNNMFSEISPFRLLATYLLDQNLATKARASMAGNLLESVGLSSKIKLCFRRGRNSKELLEDDSKKNLDIEIQLEQDYFNQKVIATRLDKLQAGAIHLSEMIFFKGDVQLELASLSSGERLYALTVLGLCFCITDEALVLFDEPENSLHPKWQARIMRDVANIVSTLAENSTVVVATHSPLIVSSAPNVNTLIRDLPSDQGWVPSELYGRNSDAVLHDQFGLTSPRALAVTTSIQECLQSLITVQLDPDRFRKSADALMKLNVSLEVSDPLYATVREIFRVRRGMA